MNYKIYYKFNNAYEFLKMETILRIRISDEKFVKIL